VGRLPFNMRSDVALLLLRLGFAALLLGFHGYARFFRAWHFAIDHQPWSFVDVVSRLGVPWPGLFAVLSALSESIGAALVGLGLFTRWAAAMFCINMIVALYNEAHKGDSIELPALYFLMAMTLAILGPGGFSLDSRWPRRRRVPRWTGA